MRAKIFTLRFDPSRGAFDDSSLQAFIADHELLSFREHIIQLGDQPYLVCATTWQTGATATTPLAPQALEARSTTEPPRAPTKTRPVDELLAGLDDTGRELFEKIRRWRAATAQREGVPPYVILTNRRLVAIISARPRNRTGLQKIDGLGQKKLDRHAAALLAQLWPSTTAVAEAGTPTTSGTTTTGCQESEKPGSEESESTEFGASTTRTEEAVT